MVGYLRQCQLQHAGPFSSREFIDVERSGFENYFSGFDESGKWFMRLLIGDGVELYRLYVECKRGNNVGVGVSNDDNKQR
jgi:hypothetical protein